MIRGQNINEKWYNVNKNVGTLSKFGTRGTNILSFIIEGLGLVVRILIMAFLPNMPEYCQT